MTWGTAPWPFSDEREESVAAEEPLPKYRYWRRQRPPPEPVLCTGGCGTDVSGLQLLVGPHPYCFKCGLGASRGEG